MEGMSLMSYSNSQAQVRLCQKPRALILIVDDEEAIRSSLSGVLNDEGFETIVAEDGAQALDSVRKFSPDVVFLDVWMPGWDGIETLERIKEASPVTQVVMISGHATISNALEAMRRGAIDLIEKPFDIESVLVAVESCLEKQSRLSTGAEKVSGRGDETSYYHGRKPLLERHEGFFSRTLPGRNLGQRTLKDSVVLYGQCLHSGIKSGLVLEPLPKNSGIHFAQIGSMKTVPVFVDYVESTGFATTIRSGTASAGTIEHLMAALHAFKISNLLIKCNGEVPIFDGSGLKFCEVIEEVGIEEQGGEWYELAIAENISYNADGSTGGEMLYVEPSETFCVTYELNYPAPVGRQTYTFEMDSVDSFKREIAPARTFGFMKDVEMLQRAGLAAGGRLDNFILIGSEKVVNTELRFAEELARHKILDAVGDLFLIGRPLRGAVHARMTGHSDNIALVKKLRTLLHQEK